MIAQSAAAQIWTDYPACRPSDARSTTTTTMAPGAAWLKVAELVGRAWPATIVATDGQATVTLIARPRHDWDVAPDWSHVPGDGAAEITYHEVGALARYGAWTVRSWTSF